MTLTRGIGFRDDALSTSAWTVIAGGGQSGTITTDGDILTFTPTWSASTAEISAKLTVTGSPSTTAYPKIMIRHKDTLGSQGFLYQLLAHHTDTSQDSFTLTSSSNWITEIFTSTSGKTVDYIIGADLIPTSSYTGSATVNIDFVMMFKETLTLPSVSGPLSMTLQRYVVELPIPTREGGVLQDLGSQSTQVEVSGVLITTTSPNNYTGDQWWDVLIGTWLEANWQWLGSDRVAGKYQIEQLAPTQDPGKVGYYGFKVRLRKVDVLSATAQTFASNTGTGAIQ